MILSISKTHLYNSLTLFLTAVIFCLPTACDRKDAKDTSPPTVQVAQVIRQDVPVYTEWIGTTDGMVNAVIRPQVQGYLIRQNYREGDFVTKGKILFEIDPRTFQAALDQAKGQLSEQQARWATAKANLKRIIPLAEQNAISTLR